MTEEEITVQVENNVAEAERVLRPIAYFSWFLGVGAARPLNSPKAVTIIIRVIHFGVCSVIVAYGAIDFFTFGSVFKSDIFKIMYYMNKITCYVTSYYYVYHGIRHYDKWPGLAGKMESLDRKIGRETTIEHGSVKIGQILAIIATCILGPVSLVVHALYYYFTLPDNIFASDLLLYYTISQTLVDSFVLNIVVHFIRQRFKAINELIEQLDFGLNANWVALKIRRIRELYNGTYDLVVEVNDIYGLHMLFASANSFTMVVAKLFRIYMSVVEKNYGFIFINNIIWMIYAGQFAVTCYVCNVTTRESEKCGSIVHRITMNSKYTGKFRKLSSFNFQRVESIETDEQNGTRQENNVDDRSTLNYFGLESLLRSNLERDCIRNEVIDFSAHLQHHRVTFSACDFFEMNNSLLTGFIGVITTYLIILVQFYRPEHANVKVFS